VVALPASNGIARELRLVSAGGPATSVIVQATPGMTGNAREAVERLGGSVDRELRIIHGFSATVPQGDIAQLRAVPGVRDVSEDQALQLLGETYSQPDDDYSMYNLNKVIGARKVWRDGFTGAGVDVALIDSGTVPVEGLKTAGKVLLGPDLTNESQNPATNQRDTFGHGTHLAGIIAGRDSGVSNWNLDENSSAFLGVAPDARIVSVKVADARGMTDVSQVIAAVDWVVEHAHDPGVNIRVINLAFGTDSAQSYMVDPLTYALEVAWRNGIVVVTSAGNAGAATGRLTLPAVDPLVLAVGADDVKDSRSPDDDSIPAFSSRGDGQRNPDLVAPGVHVQSLRVRGSYIDSKFSATGAIDSRFFRGSGTSQAAAMVSGAVALLLDQRPELTPDQVKRLLTSTAARLPRADRQAQGAGLLRVSRASNHVTPQQTQTFVPATGGGSLDLSRGSARLELDGVVLSGEKDIFGKPVATTALALAQSAGSSWSGGKWNGSTWSGSTWSGSTWSGSTWSGSTWSGSTWSSEIWATGTWTGSSWSGSSWSGSTWSGSSWSGSSWSGGTWSDSAWSSDGWY
jgi:serine protease AprX